MNLSFNALRSFCFVGMVAAPVWVFASAVEPNGAAAPILPAAPATRYSIVKDDHGVWWFQSPTGERFYSIGMNNVTPEPYQPRPGTTFYAPVAEQFKGDAGAWATSVTTLLTAHGFNTLGAWSSAAIPASGPTGSKMHTTPILYVVQHEGTRCLTPLRADFEEFVLGNVKGAIAQLPERSSILGVFLDNEMPWYGKSGWDDLPTYTLLEQALEQSATDVRRTAAIDFLKSRHPDPAELAQAYHKAVADWSSVTADWMRGCSVPAAMDDRRAFTQMLADRFYEVTTRIVRKELPDTLILGTRIPGNAPDSVIRACGRHCDVVSVNQYLSEGKPDVNALTRFWVLGGNKPLMHTEFSWRARQNASADPNSRGAGTVLETQAERAAMYSGLVADIATIPYVIGSHWFEFADQSPQGRFDGEDSNYGIVDIHNKPYTELLGGMKSTNAQVHDLHAKTKRKMPSDLPKPTNVTYTPGQHPERAPTINLLEAWIHDPEIWGASDAKLSWTLKDKNLVLTYDAGAQYGAGMNIFAPTSTKLAKGPEHAADLDGYSTIVLEATAPKGLLINIVLAEAGAAGSSSSKFDTSAGDDGEGYVSTILEGTGAKETYRVPIASLTRQQFFGNQHGAMRIDMQAIRNLGIQVSGEPRRGEMTVHAFRLDK